MVSNNKGLGFLKVYPFSLFSTYSKRKLIPWLRLILKNQTILETFYTSWSYVVKTGFDDAFRAIERLSMYVFDIPEDTAVKQFKDMNEAF